MNATQQHPFEAILGWLDSLPPDLRHTIALVVLLHVPDLTKPDDWSDRDGGETVLREWLSHLKTRRYSCWEGRNFSSHSMFKM